MMKAHVIAVTNIVGSPLTAEEEALVSQYCSSTQDEQKAADLIRTLRSDPALSKYIASASEHEGELDFFTIELLCIYFFSGTPIEDAVVQLKNGKRYNSKEN